MNAGDHTITASYGGDSQFPAKPPSYGDRQPGLDHHGGQCLGRHATFGQSVTLTATVTAAPSNRDPHRDGHFHGGSTVLGTATLSGGVAPVHHAVLPAGTDVVTAAYSGDGVNFSGSTSALVGPASIISTVAGNGSVWGDSGDGGPATAARLGSRQRRGGRRRRPLHRRVHDSRIREVNHATGVITTIAGNGTSGYSGDSGPATAAELGRPDRQTSRDAAGESSSPTGTTTGSARSITPPA